MKTSYQRGMSALFIVIFASILLSLIAVSFASLMVQEQIRSSDDELSQGAYDAAVAGTEDGKRALLECLGGSVAACAEIDNQQCNTVSEIGIAGSPGDDEVVIQSNAVGDGEELNLAYTCVIVERDTDDYLGVLANHDESVVVPLKVDPSDSFSKVRISWFSPNDIASGESPTLPNDPVLEPLAPLDAYDPTYPPILRAQLMQYNRGSLSDAGTFNDAPYAHTLYLYPETTGLASTSFADDSRRSSAGSNLQRVQCATSFPITGYACETAVTLPNGAGAIDPSTREAFLRLTSLYKGTHFKIEILDDADSIVQFSNVQPRIDSTGRANDIFRRVESRVEFIDDFPYPRATVDITNNFCKTFFVGSVAEDFSDGGCLPTDP